MTSLPEPIETGRAIAPGEYLREELSARHMSQMELARRMGRPSQVVNEIVNDRKALTQETALELERVLGTPASVWVGLEARYRLALARETEVEGLRNQVRWLSRFPLREMEGRGWIPTEKSRIERVRAVLRFFGVASFSNWEEYQDVLGFRITGNAKIDTGALEAWVRQGEIEGDRIRTDAYEEAKFREVLNRARLVTRKPPESGWPELQQMCASAGVAAVVVREFPRIGANGVAKWLTPTKALIQLNLRYSWADIFWFTFFHEAGHILTHKSRQAFIDLDGNPRRDPRELEANRLAEEILIPTADWERFVLRSTFDSISVDRFARELKIHPGIVVGRLQHAALVPWQSNLNSMRERLQWSE